MDWDHLRIFLAIARTGQILAAARRLRLDHATVSRRLTALEDQLGAMLFERRTTGCVPTAAGESLVEIAERVEREADIAITLARPEEGRLFARKLTDYRLSLYASRGYLARTGPIGSKADLAGRTLVTYAQDFVYSPALDYAGELAALVRSRFECASVVGQLEAAITQHLQGRLGDVAERITTLPRLADMVLPADVEDSVTEFLARQRLGRQVYEEWGLSRIATTGRGLTALFAGGPGTGKTMLAGAIAHELGLDLYRVDLSRIMSKWIGETERNLAAVFAAAEDGHAIVLFDEADSLFAKRTEVKSAGDRHANVEVNYLLQRLDTFTGICILTTNFGTAIDPAFKRRLAFRVTFPIPDEELRELLWRRHLPPGVPVADDLDLAELARRFHLSGGAVRNCALRAAFLAAADGRVISQAHLLRAIRIEYRAVGKLAEGGPLE